MRQAKEKVWLTRDNKLVKDGHEDAFILFAAEGQVVPDEYVEDIKGSDSFFKEVTPPHPEPTRPAPRVEQFEPGQSNATAVAGPKEKVGPVKTIGGAEPTGKTGDHEAAFSQKGQGILDKPETAKTTKTTTTKTTKTTNKKKGR